jgi:hypothetical protein
MFAHVFIPVDSAVCGSCVLVTELVKQNVLIRH